MTSNDLTMPKLGLTMTEGVLSAWQVKPGDRVRAGQVLFVVETDKLATDVEAPSDGEILELVVPNGATAQVGERVARWTGRPGVTGDEGVATLSPEDAVLTGVAAAPSQVEAQSQAVPFARTGEARQRMTPLARRLARLNEIKLTDLVGTGARGQIRARDVEARAEALQAVAAKSASAPQPSPSMPAPASGAAAIRAAATPLQATVARRLTAAKRDIPHFYLSTEADLGALFQLRASLNADERQLRLSINHFVMAAVARVWTLEPDANRVWEDDGFLTPATVDIGLAVDTPRGLLAPVIRDAGALGLDALASAADALAARAREGRLANADLVGGVASVSNVGANGPTYLTPIINPSQSAILGVGAVREVFRPDREGRPELRRELGLVLACDHRVFNGVFASRLLTAIVDLIESPLRLLRCAPGKE